MNRKSFLAGLLTLPFVGKLFGAKEPVSEFGPPGTVRFDGGPPRNLYTMNFVSDLGRESFCIEFIRHASDRSPFYPKYDVKWIFINTGARRFKIEVEKITLLSTIPICEPGVIHFQPLGEHKVVPSIILGFVRQIVHLYG